LIPRYRGINIAAYRKITPNIFH